MGLYLGDYPAVIIYDLDIAKQLFRLVSSSVTTQLSLSVSGHSKTAVQVSLYLGDYPAVIIYNLDIANCSGESLSL